MRLSDLLQLIPKRDIIWKNDHQQKTQSIDQMDIVKIETNSRLVQTGDIFVAIKGSQVDSHQFIPDVVQRGVQVLLVEDKQCVPANYSGLVWQLRSTRDVLPLLAAKFFCNPSQDLFCFGVTGTNGKTSCTYMMQKILSSFRLRTGIIGTIEHRLGDQVWPASATTPGPMELQERLQQMKSAGASAVVMEVSSHALDQKRVDGVQFNAVLFTNLTRDHLDYHQDMQNYFFAKQRLFTDLVWQSSKRPLIAAVNIDQDWGRRLKVNSHAEVITFGQKNGADFQIQIQNVSYAQTEFVLNIAGQKILSHLPMCGAHNVENAVGCVASSLALGISPELSLKALQDFAGVPGRLQRVENNKDISVFIDYAHSPDALSNVLNAIQLVRKQSGQSSSKIITVFGCGGDRDRGKRPLMAAVAEKLSDQVVITSDNPRNEDPETILSEIEKGFSHPEGVIKITDRKEAIYWAIQRAQAGDVVLIAGKGHEDYQIIGNEKLNFSDVAVAQKAIDIK